MAELEKPISKMIVKDLRAELQKRGLETKGLKADLVKRLEEALAGTKENGGEEVEETATEEKEGEVEEEKPKRGQKRKSSRGTPKVERKKKEVEPKPKSSPKRARKVPQRKSPRKPTEKGDKGNEEGEEEGEKEEMVAEKKEEKPVEKKEEKVAEKKEEKKPVEEKKKEEKPVEKKEEKAPEKKEGPVKKGEKTTAQKTAPQKKEEEKKPVEEKKAPEKKEETKAAPESKGSPNSGETSSPAISRRQRRWGPSSNSDVGSISTDTIKEILTVPPEPAPAPITAATPKRKREEPEATAETPRKEAAPLAKTPAKVQKKDEEVKPEVREVPPSKKPVSNVLLITHFVRPFTKPAVKELLSQTGKVVEWGMDEIKSRCFVIYETGQEAEATRSALHNLCWPPTNKTRLQVDFSTETEAKRAVNRGVVEKPRTKTPPPQEKAVTLDDLFRKTAAKPHIYYLPLTDSEVEEKKKTVAEGQQPTNGAPQSQNQEK